MYTITNNSPQAGCIRWANLNIQYKGANYEIADGYTNLPYIYWAASSPNMLVHSSTYPQFTADDCLVFLNKSGTALVVPGATAIDGGLIVPGSILANAIAANAITGDKIVAGTISSANIAANAIGAANIAAGAVTADKLNAGSVTTAKLGANAVTAAKLDVSEIFANAALIRAIKAANIDVDEFFANQAVIGKLNTADISNNGSISLTVGNAIDGVVVGGRNLLLGSSDENGVYRISEPIVTGLEYAISTSGADRAWYNNHAIEMLEGADGRYTAVFEAEDAEPQTATGDIVTLSDIPPGYPLDIVSQIAPVQTGEGDPSPVNIRLITGWTGANLWHCGKNILTAFQTNANYLNLTNDDFVLLRPGTYTFSIGSCTAAAWRFCYAFQDMERNRITFDDISGVPQGVTIQWGGYWNVTGQYHVWYNDRSHVSEQITVTQPIYICVLYSAVAGAIFTNPQLELGSASTPYEPYAGDVYNAAFGQTVYGGAYDWATGTLTIDKARVELDGTEYCVTDGGQDTTDTVYVRCHAIDDVAAISTALCSHLPYARVWNGTEPAFYLYNYDNGKLRFRVPRTIANSVSEFKAYLAAQYAAGTPVQVCYTLAEPITVQLTPQEIPSLLGDNTLYCDTGDITVAEGTQPNDEIAFAHGATLVKLERGNKPTDWTPAPEDVASAIDGAQAQAQAQAQSELRRVARLDSRGLHVGDSETANEVLIDSHSVNVVTGGLMEAKFASSYIQFGNYQLRKTADGGLAFKLKEV